MTYSRTFLLASSLLVLLMGCNRSGSKMSDVPNEAQWTEIAEPSMPAEYLDLGEGEKPVQARYFQLNKEEIVKILDRAPHREDIAAGESPCLLAFPVPGDGPVTFRMTRTSLMEKELADKFPELNTYEGVATTDPAVLIRVTRNQWGLDAMILSPEGTVFIDPFKSTAGVYYIVYNKSDFITDKRDRFFEPSTIKKP